MNKKTIKSTPFGPVDIIWARFKDGPKIVHVLIPKPGLSAEEQASRLYPGSMAASCAEVDALATAMEAFLEGQDVTFSLRVVCMKMCSAFQQSVLVAEHRIPRGSVSTYQLIAAHLGMPNGARAVGNALATNPYPLIVPCHRVIRSDGHLGGYGGGPEMKRALLEREGVAFDGEGRVIGTRFHYEPGA